MCEHCICKHSTCYNNFKEAKSNDVTICFTFTDVLRVETKVSFRVEQSRSISSMMLDQIFLITSYVISAMLVQMQRGCRLQSWAAKQNCTSRFPLAASEQFYCHLHSIAVDFLIKCYSQCFALPCLCHLQGVFYCSALKIR